MLDIIATGESVAADVRYTLRHDDLGNLILIFECFCTYCRYNAAVERRRQINCRIAAGVAADRDISVAQKFVLQALAGFMFAADGAALRAPDMCGIIRRKHVFLCFSANRADALLIAVLAGCRFDRFPRAVLMSGRIKRFLLQNTANRAGMLSRSVFGAGHGFRDNPFAETVSGSIDFGFVARAKQNGGAQRDDAQNYG